MGLFKWLLSSATFCSMPAKGIRTRYMAAWQEAREHMGLEPYKAIYWAWDRSLDDYEYRPEGAANPERRVMGELISRYLSAAMAAPEAAETASKILACIMYPACLKKPAYRNAFKSLYEICGQATNREDEMNERFIKMNPQSSAEYPLGPKAPIISSEAASLHKALNLHYPVT